MLLRLRQKNGTIDKRRRNQPFDLRTIGLVGAARIQRHRAGVLRAIAHQADDAAHEEIRAPRPLEFGGEDHGLIR
ncbi:hypothetical protein D9M72_549090 [compost metagenome]